MTENMIPGNRPEDEAEERFWDALAKELEDRGMSKEFVDKACDDLELGLAINAARDIAYAEGMQDGRAEEQMALAADMTDRAERRARMPWYHRVIRALLD